jgi:GNAT superfamily N-acetyltransferase
MQLDRLAIIQQRLVAGKRCYVAQVEGSLAAYGWVSYQEEDIGEIHLRIHLMPGEAYIWDCATAPAYRQQRLYTGLLMHIATQLQTEGLCRVWIGADGDNIASQRGMASAGFQPVVDLVETRLLAMRLFRVRGRLSAPKSVVADARRALRGNRDRAWLAALSLVNVPSTGSSSNVVPGG